MDPAGPVGFAAAIIFWKGLIDLSISFFLSNDLEAKLFYWISSSESIAIL